LWCAKTCQDYQKQGYTIYSNVHFKFPYKKIKYDDIINCRYRDAVVYIDEAHLVLPARGSMRKSSILIVDNFISMSSKANLICIFTTQFPEKIDMRISQLEKDYNVLAEKIVYENGTWHGTSKDAKELKDTPTIIMITVEQCFDGQIIKCPPIYANDYYKIYNRYEIVNIEGLDEASIRYTEKQKLLKEKIRNELKQP